ncbi:MAG: DegT/DnrJ/EryC1/StrS family aminotransferase [Chthoniobacterales bacterium]|nr:DegT/DnrJ/EryC1/StrS family aminotransferase [Chthoniobacterales bacterium]
MSSDVLQPIPLFDLSRQSQNTELTASIKVAVERVLDHQQFILGKETVALEQEMETACFDNKAHAVGVSSGTDGLLAILIAKNITVGDAVITTPYTFFATASCVHRMGAEIVFCDIDSKTYMIDPEKLRIILASFKREANGTLRTAKGNRVKMIIPIHLFGTCCDMDAIMALAQEYGLTVVEDAAQVIGADYPSKEGLKKAGAIAEMSFVSFYPTKNLGAFGDAGLVACLDPKMAEQLRIVRNHGMEERYYHKVVGGNFRLDGIQAAVLRARLPFLSQWNEQRQKNAAIYKEAFTKAGLLDRLALPAEPWAASGLKNHHIYHQYVIRILGDEAVAQREKIIAHFNKNQIGYAIYYPVPLHLQECFTYLGHKPGAYPESERAAQETLALPIFPELKPEEIQAVVAAIAEALAK